MFSIGEFARLGQVSVKKLRHYDSIGLLRPARVDPASGYRYYTAAQLPAIGRIVALRDLGFGLAEIAAMSAGAGAGDAADADIYAAQERQVRESIAVSQTRLRRLTASRAWLEGRQSAVLVRAVPRLLVATRQDRDFAELERQVAGYGIRADAPPMTLIGYDVLAAVPVKRGVPGVTAQVLPAVTEMACCRYQGGYGGLAAAWQALLDWVRKEGAEPGCELREVYLSFSAESELALRADYLTESPAGFVTELQVPMNYGAWL
jgi:DNA-binding transcriptional MerR regulator